MKILLTGGSGFVGGHVQAALDCVSLAGTDGREVDIRNPSAVEDAVCRLQFDAVLHLAALSSVRESLSDPRTTYQVNFMGTYNLLAALQIKRFSGRVLYIGSSEEYGDVEDASLPVKEEQPLRPGSPYGVSKAAAELLCCQYSRAGTLDIVCVRPFLHTGPGQAPTFVIPALARQIINIRRGKQTPVVTLGDPDITRDVLDVRDVVAAYAAVLEHGRSGYVYNVCTGVERRIGDLAVMLLDMAGVRAELRTDVKLVREHEQKRMAGEGMKLRTETGWTPRIPLAQTLRDILQDWEERTE